MKKIFLILTIISFFALYINAQTTVEGTVTEEDGRALPGVTVQAKGTTVATMTDSDGKYSIEVPEDSNSLIFTYVGMETQEIEITGDIINVVMKVGDSELEEVVVSALGVTRERKSLGYSVSEVSSNDMVNVKANKKNSKKLQKSSKTWKRANNDVNAMKLFVGDTESIPLKGSQIAVKIDGFRARVVIDCFFYGYDRNIMFV